MQDRKEENLVLFGPFGGYHCLLNIQVYGGSSEEVEVRVNRSEDNGVENGSV